MAIMPDLPDLPANLTQYCLDPGVGQIDTTDQAVTVIGANRLYAACEKRKHRDSINFYRKVKREFAGPR